MNDGCINSRGAGATHHQVHHQQQRPEFDQRTQDDFPTSMEIDSPVSPSEQDTSQWHRDEHARFMQALETYGGDKSGEEWHKIAAFVQTRSIEDVRLHGRTYLHHLMQLQQSSPRGNTNNNKSFMVNPLQYPLTASRELQALGANQNDPNGQNYTSNSSYSNHHESKSTGGKTKHKTSAKVPSRSYLNTPHSSGTAMPMESSQSHTGGMGDVPSSHKKTSNASTRPPKVWSFQDDKILEMSLATWTSGKPYSWPKIAAVLPGKTAKDVRARYERLVEDVANIDNNNLTKPSSEEVVPSTKSTHSSRPPTHSSSGLSSRIAPPPPIEVSPMSKGKNMSNKVSTIGFTGTGMLSPTFLDFLTGEEKPSIQSSTQSSPSPTVANTPSSLVSSGFLSSPLHLEMNATPQHHRQHISKEVSTPRIWHDFLSEDFKMDQKSRVSPHESDTRQKNTSRRSPKM